MIRVHVCLFDAECRRYGAPKRLYVTTKRLGGLSIGERSLGWLPVLGYLPWWGPWRRWTWLTWWFIVYEPPRRKPGLLVRRYPHWYGMKTRTDDGSED